MKYALFHFNWTKADLHKNMSHFDLTFKPTVEDVMAAVKDGLYDLVHVFEDIDNYEDVFSKSQNVDDNWNQEFPCRSTSVGDVIVQIGSTASVAQVVAPCGFMPVIGFTDYEDVVV